MGVSKPQLAIVLDQEALDARNAQPAINLLRSLLQSPAPILNNFFGGIGYRFARSDESQVSLLDRKARGCARDIAHAVPEILFFLPTDSMADFVYMFSSIEIVERDGEGTARVSVKTDELRFQLRPLLRGLKMAMTNAGFAVETIDRHLGKVLDHFGVPYDQREGFLS